MKKEKTTIEYEVELGPKDISDLMSKFDLGIDGVITETVICVITTRSIVNDALIQKHKRALKEGFSKDFYVGDITTKSIV